MSDPSRGRTPKDPFVRPGSSSSMRESRSNMAPASRVSFMLNTMSDSGPASESSHQIAFMLNTSSPSEDDSFSYPKKSRARSGHTSDDSISQPEDLVSSSFIAFMSHSVSSRPTREKQPIFKPRGTAADKRSQETKDTARVSRLAPHRAPSNTSAVSDQVQKHLLLFNLSKEKLLAVKDSMLEALERGLKHHVKGGSSLPMLPTYVCAMPDGSERGSFLALQMSQTQVKVLLLQLTSKDIKEAVLKTKDFDITENIMKGTGDQLFEFLAQCLAKFLAEIDTKEKYFPLGFSFPFHLQHSSLNQCMLIQSSKDFRWSGMAGNDLAQQLQTAINQQCKNYQIEVIAVVSDTVGTMMSCYNEKNPCAAGLVIDAGTNCCYMEEAQYIVGVKENEGRMCMNTEWGFFGNAGELDDLITEFDLLMDKQSMNPGENRFDKLIGSLYVSDTIRCCLARLAEKGELFNGVLTPNLLTKGNLELHDIIEITDEKLGLSKTKNFLLRQGMVASNQDCFDVQQICQAVFIRSAKLCAAGLAAVLTRIRNAQQLPQLKVSVAVDGNLYKSHKWYCEILQETLTSLAPECTVSFVPASNGIAVGVAMVTAAALRSRTQKQQVVQILAPFRLPVSDLERLRNLMRLEMEKGLSKETYGTASLRMLPTFVRGLPDGTERGKYMALDLGGTNFRVLMVEVRSKEEGGVYMTTEIYTITPEIAQSNATELFDHIVSCIIDFEKKHKVIGATLPLGFTFSFPCKQINLDKGILLAWTKGFSASGCVGEDAVQLLREAVQRQENFDLDVVAIVNDTVGTMMSCAYEDPKCEIGLIVGTGCNACYMEEMRNIGTLDGDEGRMCINMEWGAFGDNGCLEHFFTPFDVKVNEESINVGQQRYEKLISGMYLGEIVRSILLELTERKVLFQGRDARMLQVKDIFPTKFLSEIEKEGLGQQQLCAILEEYKLDASPDDAMVVKEVCCAVSSRAAKVCGAGMAAIVEKIRENRQLEKLEVTAGVDGTLYKVHPTFSKQFAETVALLAPKCKVKFLLSEDGSGKGAALIAAVASRKDMKALG